MLGDDAIAGQHRHTRRVRVMLVCFLWFAAYWLSLRQIDETGAERGVAVDHAAIHRWSIKILPVRAAVFRWCKRSVGKRGRMDETYVKVSGKWKFPYRALIRAGQLVCLLSEHEAMKRQYDNRAGHTI